MEGKRQMHTIGLGLNLDKIEDLRLKIGLDSLMLQKNRPASYFVREGLRILINNKGSVGSATGSAGSIKDLQELNEQTITNDRQFYY